MTYETPRNVGQPKHFNLAHSSSASLFLVNNDILPHLLATAISVFLAPTEKPEFVKSMPALNLNAVNRTFNNVSGTRLRKFEAPLTPGRQTPLQLQFFCCLKKVSHKKFSFKMVLILKNGSQALVVMIHLLITTTL
ncbi:hypothetical protein MTR_8g039410 [Medicago truncatula]|uniref:Uncharacterized protein n=1 Tax=Medicago truncatula TaxID=3880 RepID=G7LG41_MEDTR|nr:hypothetical protein MTR_8g039410 [Medicago truncatula]